jgi:hypothetical protein
MGAEMAKHRVTVLPKGLLLRIDEDLATRRLRRGALDRDILAINLVEQREIVVVDAARRSPLALEPCETKPVVASNRRPHRPCDARKCDVRWASYPPTSIATSVEVLRNGLEQAALPDTPAGTS